MHNSDFQNKIEQFQDLINNCNHIVFFGGAGVSTESGVPDFRSKDGLYNQHDVQFEEYQPEYLLSHSCLYNEPKVFFEYYKQKMDCRGVKPNITHKKLAELEKSGKLSAVITQNIDGLHQKAGSKKVLEVHGTTQRVYCDKCGKQFDPDTLFTFKGDIPFCDCGGMLRPDVTLYEEQLPVQAWQESMEVLRHSDLLIIGGTSLAVYPANTLIQYYGGGNIVIINRDSTPQDRFADILFHENLGKVFGEIKYNIT